MNLKVEIEFKKILVCVCVWIMKLNNQKIETNWWWDDRIWKMAYLRKQRSGSDELIEIGDLNGKRELGFWKKRGSLYFKVRKRKV